MTDDFVRSDLPRYGRTPRELLRDPNMSDRAVRLYALLDDYAGVDGRAFPSRATLASACGCSVPSIARDLAQLVKTGWIVATQRFDATGRQTSTLYALTAGPASLVTRRGVTGDTGGAAPVIHEGEPREEQPPSPPKGGRDRREAQDGDPAWESFWSAYPRKTGKGHARKAFPAALDKVDGDVTVLVSAALAFTRTISEIRFAPHPATWLRAERWLDDLSSLGGQAPGSHTPDPNRRVNWRKGMPECPDHDGQHLDRCPACASERLAGDR